MKNDTNKIKILIACPSDAENIKELIEQCCTNINTEIQMESKLEFEILHWRKSVSAIITGERPQDIINREYEEQEYDVFIGIFWKRFGDRQTNGKTPTEEEFERALNGKKKNDKPKIVKIYFKLDEESLPRNREELVQIGEILDFKDRLKDLGLYAEFYEKNFIHFFYRELHYILRKFKEPTQISIQENPSTINLNKYHILRSLIKAEDYNKYNSMYLDASKVNSLDLIKTKNRVVIIGDAGTGKTEEINFIANYFSNVEEGLVPIIIRLKNYVDQDVDDFLNTKYQKIKDENLLLLFDGFDEVESKNKMTLIRKILFYEEQHPNVNIVITSRKNAYNNELNNFEVYYLLNLNNEDIENFISRIRHD